VRGELRRRQIPLAREASETSSSISRPYFYESRGKSAEAERRNRSISEASEPRRLRFCRAALTRRASLSVSRARALAETGDAVVPALLALLRALAVSSSSMRPRAP
jgi:hypothetical protein